MKPIEEYHAIVSTLNSDDRHSFQAYLIGALLVSITPKVWESCLITVRMFMPLSNPAEDEAATAASGEDRPNPPCEDGCSEATSTTTGEQQPPTGCVGRQ